MKILRKALKALQLIFMIALAVACLGMVPILIPRFERFDKETTIELVDKKEDEDPD